MRLATSMEPVGPAVLLARPRLERQLASARAHRLTSVIAEAGSGKSTLLATWAASMPSAWYTMGDRDADAVELCRSLLGCLATGTARGPVGRGVAGPSLLMGHGPDADPASSGEALADLVCQRLEARGRRDLLLVLDDVHRIPAGSSGAHLLEALVRTAPATNHVVLGSRTEPPFPTERLRGQGQAIELHASELAFTAQEVERLVGAVLGPDAALALAPQLHEVTGGWPAAVHLALEAVREVPAAHRSAVIAALPARHGPLLDYLAREVIGRLAPADLGILQRLALFDRIPPDLLRVPGIIAADGHVPDLSRRGLLVETALDGRIALHALLRRYLQEWMPLPVRTRRGVHRRAARWLESLGRHAEAMDSLRHAEDLGALDRMVRQRGRDVLEHGGVRELLDAIEALPVRSRDRELDLIDGEARMVAGDTRGALACFERACGRRHRLPAGLAWRMGLLRYLRGELPEALAAFSRGRTDSGDPRDISLLLAWTATGHWLSRDLGAARDEAARALDVARVAGADTCFAAAHTVLAMLASIDGDSAAMEEESAAAIRAAERAGDMLQLVRALTNRASHRADDGRFREALDDLELAITNADVSGYAFFHALALSNRGSLLASTGQLEAATTSLQASLVIYRRMGSRSARYPLLGLGDVHRVRGDHALARAAFGEALGYAEAAADRQALPPILAGLACCLPDDEHARATELARRARDFGAGPARAGALVASGWVALADVPHTRTGPVDAGGDKPLTGLEGPGASASRSSGPEPEAAAVAREAAEFSREAMAEATRRGDPAGQAAALELLAMTTTDPTARRASLTEARQVWRRLGDPVGEARVDVALVRLFGSDATGLDETVCLQRLASLGVGVAPVAMAPGLLREARPMTGAPVSIRTLGGFAVEHDGVPVTASGWQSRKARDLVKLLVARRGHRVSREVLMESLWPGEAPGPLHNRLSVALATARSVLQRGSGAGAAQVIHADSTAVWLDLGAVAIDVELFLGACEAASASVSSGGNGAATASLQAAEAAYRGDFLKEDADADWAVPLREQARSAYLTVTRLLAQRMRDDGDLDTAARYALRILELDPWDEDAHLWLVRMLEAAGRHGEARRQYRAYVARMRELDVEPVTFEEPRRIGSGSDG